MITSLLKSRYLFCCSISLNPYKWHFKLAITEKKKKKEINSIVSLYIADVRPISFIYEHCL